MKTKKEIVYKSSPYGVIATIPAGAKVSPASNLPDGGYWIERWPGMSDLEISWLRNYGFHVAESEIEKTDCDILKPILDSPMPANQRATKNN